MNSYENNNYVRILNPVLLLMKISGIIPISLKIKGARWYNFKSRLISIIGLVIFIWNLINNLRLINEDFVQTFKHNFEVRNIVAFIPGLLLRSMIFLIPLTLWTKLQHLRNHWSNWKNFQDEYKIVLDQDFNSKFQNRFRWGAIRAIGSVIFTYFISQSHLTIEIEYTRRISDNLNISLIYFIVTYWLSSCTYVRLIGREINLNAKKCIHDGINGQKLKVFAIIWNSLYDLLEEFIEVHSLFFSIYFMEVLASVIFMAYISFNYSYFSKLYDQWIAVLTLFITVYMIYIICEVLHNVHKQIYFEQKEMLLEQNTWKMDKTMLQSVSRFLDTILMKPPSITFDGGTPIDRSYFVHAVIMIINYMIILRQFQR